MHLSDGEINLSVTFERSFFSIEECFHELYFITFPRDNGMLCQLKYGTEVLIT